MTGRRKALDHLWAHERRRGCQRLSPDERHWLNSLGSPDLEQHVRELNAVDRAIDGYRRGPRFEFEPPGTPREEAA